MIINYLPKDQTDAPLSRKGEGLADRKAGYSPVGERRAEDQRYRRLSEFFRVQNSAQVDIHYRAARDGETARELTAYSDVAPDQVEALLAELNSGAF